MNEAVLTNTVEDVLTADYLTGFGNEHESEAVPGTLPIGRNNPQRVAHGLYAEQISGTAFTAPRARNRRSWFYRIRPSVKHGAYREIDASLIRTAPTDDAEVPCMPLRWDPFPLSEKSQDFLDGWVTYNTNGNCALQMGMATHMYACNKSMEGRFLQVTDGELLIVPQQGRLVLRTEAGVLHLAPGDIGVVPRGIKFAVDLLDGPSRGYICENYGSCLELPERGPIGANSLASARDFQYPKAAFEQSDGDFELVMKAGGKLFACELEASPLDVVAWHGNHAPYKYDLRRFNAMGSISYDHPDPSIFTVLTSQSDTPGIANIDFVIFPPRWLVAEETFRPPWYHMNIMSEFMGLIYGQYDAKPEGFLPGGASLHNCMIPHGPDKDAFEGASAADLNPHKLDDTMAFMFESRYPFNPTNAAMNGSELQSGYADCWAGLEANFKG